MQLKNLSKKESPLHPNMPVIISLSAPNENGVRVTVDYEKVFVKDLPQVDKPINIEAIKFPKEEINQVNSDSSLEPVEKAQKISEIIQKYHRKLQESEEWGRELLVKEIHLLLMVREYLTQKHNFSYINSSESDLDCVISSLNVTIIRTLETGETAFVTVSYS